MLDINLSYSKSSGVWNVNEIPENIELPQKAKTLQKQIVNPFQVLVKSEGIEQLAMVYPKFMKS